MNRADHSEPSSQPSPYRLQEVVKRAAAWINEQVEGVTVDNTLTDLNAYCLPIPRTVTVDRGAFRLRLVHNRNVHETKVIDLPASLLDGTELVAEDKDTAAEQDTEFHARELTDKLRPAGFDVLVQQTGGGTATIYATRGGLTVVGGPGAFNWSDPEESVFDSSDFYVGIEDSEDGGRAVEAGASMEAVTALFTAAAGAV